MRDRGSLGGSSRMSLGGIILTKQLSMISGNHINRITIPPSPTNTAGLERNLVEPKSQVARYQFAGLFHHCRITIKVIVLMSLYASAAMAAANGRYNSSDAIKLD